MLAWRVEWRAARVSVHIESREHSRQPNGNSKSKFSSGFQNYSPLAVGYPLSTQFVPKLSEM